MKIEIEDIKKKIEELETYSISDGERYKELLMFINCDYIYDNIKSKIYRIIRDNNVKISPADMIVDFNLMGNFDRLEKYRLIAKEQGLEQNVVSGLIRLEAELQNRVYCRNTKKYKRIKND